MPRCLMAKKWKAAPAAELEETDEEIDVVGDGRGRSPAPAATAPGPPPRDPEPTLLYNVELIDEESEEKIRSYFEDVANKNDISAEKFKEVVGKVASEQKKSVEDLSKNLAQ